MTNRLIRPAIKVDHTALLAIWYRSVKTSHHFLTQQDINGFYQQLKELWLDDVELWLLEDKQQIVGFIGLDNNKIEMLFVDEQSQGKGYGKQLIDFVKQRYSKILLDVNEQNPDALKFYQKQGFSVTGRSDLDSQGNPFPLLHLVYQSDIAH